MNKNSSHFAALSGALGSQQFLGGLYIAASFALGCLLTWGITAVRPPTIAGDLASLSVPPPSASSFANQSMRLMNERRYAEAIDTCTRGMSIHGPDPLLANNLAVAHLQLGQIAPAEAALKQALEAKPDYQLAKNNLGWAKGLRSEAEGKVVANRTALASTTDPERKAALLRDMAAAHTQLGELNNTVADYNAILAFNPSDDVAANNAGVALMGLKEYSAARAKFRQAAALRPDAELYRNNIGWANRMLRESDSDH